MSVLYQRKVFLLEYFISRVSTNLNCPLPVSSICHSFLIPAMDFALCLLNSTENMIWERNESLFISSLPEFTREETISTVATNSYGRYLLFLRLLSIYWLLSANDLHSSHTHTKFWKTYKEKTRHSKVGYIAFLKAA